MLWDTSKIKVNAEVVGLLELLEPLRLNGQLLEIPLLSSLNKCWWIAVWEIATVDGQIELMTPSSVKEAIVLNQTILTKLAMVCIDFPPFFQVAKWPISSKIDLVLNLFVI
jgi:hypothetical protein